MYKEYLKKVIGCAIDESDEMLIRELCDEKLIKMIEKIQNVLQNYDGNDFECVEEIMAIMDENGFYCGYCHDF